MGLIAPERPPTGAAARALVVNAEPQCLVGLRIVLRHRGRLLTDRHLLRAAWGEKRGEDTRCLRVTVARLRAKLERDPWRSGYLIAEPGIGYRLRAPSEVTW